MSRRLRLKWIAAIFAAVAASLACAGPALAASFVVNDPGDDVDAVPGDTICEVTASVGDCTLRAAGEEANFSVEADVIDVDPSVVMPITLGGPIVITAPLTIDGNGSTGVDATVVDGGDAVQLFSVTSSADPLTTFRDLRLEDGALTNGGAGAGIRTDANTTLDNVVLSSSSISGLIADAHGAGIASAGALTLVDTTVSGNAIATGTGSAQGGGIWADGDLSLLRSTVSGNSVTGLGAQGGGVFAGSDPGARSIVNSTISGNSSPLSGTGAAGLEIGEDATIINTTFAENTGSIAGADLVLFGAETAITARNTIFASASTCLEIDGAALTGTNSIDSGTGCNLTGAGNQQGTDPLLAPLAPNPPGSTMTHSIALGSPALDAADSGCGGGLVFDQRGFERSHGGPICDVGSYEAEHRQLTATRSGTGDGIVTGTGIGCGSDCSESYVEASTIVLTATPATGSDLTSWSGCDSTAGDQCTVTLGNDRLVMFTFTLEPTAAQPGGGDATTPTPPAKKEKKCKKRRKQAVTAAAKKCKKR
jgi:hypothetical protein